MGLMHYTFFVSGGIGDILLVSEGISELVETYGTAELRGIVFSHFRGARQLVEPHGVVCDYHYYSNQSELEACGKLHLDTIRDDPFFLGHAKLYGYDHYPKITWPDGAQNQTEINGKCIAVHPFGSPFANDFLVNRRQVASKNMSKECFLTILEQIRDKLGQQCGIIVIGAPGEEREWFESAMQYSKVERVLPVFDENIWKAFDIVAQCDGIIAADSAMKSFSAICKKPTVVLLGDHDDKQRDQVFIRPYVEDKVITTIPFSRGTGKEHAVRAVEALMEKISHEEV